ncbi:serine/threonine-protein kinase [Teredinibacter purpureus]|uniref:serine/threonine-protein kinase n=1 Tax=Teredinibacter purpureus TaxID=2731756 RepID=UPI0005F8086A|nr:serine/threonine-protein kinase [Teredinibacter purpureus]
MTTTQSARDNELYPKRMVARYELQQLIGEGAFGEVYLAYHLSSQQPVALKILKAGTKRGADNRRKRFIKEIAICRNLQHPNVVQYLDHGESEQGEMYAVFEYISGVNLRELLNTNTPIPIGTVVEIMGQVLRALGKAHQLGIIHRDLKPSNIMVRFVAGLPEIKLLDFGASCWLTAERENATEQLTLSSDTMGSPLYLSPEQLRGELATVRSDIYSWGLLLYECLVGRPAFMGGTYAEICYQQLLPNEVNYPYSVLAHPVCRLLKKALSKKPETRIGSVTALDQWLSAIDFSTLDCMEGEKQIPLFDETLAAKAEKF